MCRKKITFAFVSLLILLCMSACSCVSDVVNQPKKNKAIRVADDLKNLKEKSQYFGKDEVGKGVLVSTEGGSNKWYVQYYIWPFGPFAILSVETGEWHFQE